MVTSVAEPKPISAPAMTLPVALQRLTQQRDPQAWEALLLHSGEDILRISRRILGDAALAEDACQETLLQIRAHAGVFKPPVSQKEAQQAARVWIMRIASNIALRMGRGRIRNQKRELRGAEKMKTVDMNCPESNTLRGVVCRHVAGGAACVSGRASAPFCHAPSALQRSDGTCDFGKNGCTPIPAGAAAAWRLVIWMVIVRPLSHRT